MSVTIASPIAHETSDAAERVRHHVRKVLGQLRTLKEQLRDQSPSPPVSDWVGEIEGEEPVSRIIDGDKGPS